MPGGPAATGGGIGADAPKNKFAGILMTCFAAFGGILFGYDTGVISGVKEMKVWLCQFGDPTDDVERWPSGCGISSSTESLVVSILSAGTFFGALLASPAADHLGRKMGIIAACAVFCVGVAMQTGSTAIPLFVVGRVFAGLGVGLVSCLVPMYQSECAPKWIRGAIVALYQWAITIGLLLAACVNQGTKDRQDHSSWRIPTAIQFVWAAVLAGGMLMLPESPRWYIKRGRYDDAAASLSRLTSLAPNDPIVELEIADIRSNLKAEEELGESSYIDCFRNTKNRIGLRTWTGILLQGWQQLTGINFIFYYGTTFFQNSGIRNPFLITIATNIVNVFMTLPGIWAVEKVGRRKLLLYGAIGMCICEYLVAIIGVTVGSDNVAAQRALIALVCIYIAHFAATWGPIAWIVTGEIFPLNVRAKSMSLSVASNWLWNFAIGYATPYLVNREPGSAGLEVKVFFIWGSTCLGCFLFTYFFVPETKGLSLEQIDMMYTLAPPLKAGPVRKRLMTEDIHASDAQAFHKADGHSEAHEKV